VSLACRLNGEAILYKSVRKREITLIWISFWLVIGGCSSTANRKIAESPAVYPKDLSSFEPMRKSSDREKILRLMNSLIGFKYEWDRNGPDENNPDAPLKFDCSGFVHFVLLQTFGEEVFDLPYKREKMPGYHAQSIFYRDWLTQRKMKLPDCREAKIGDIVFFPKRANKIQHIGIVSSKAPLKFITAQSQDLGVQQRDFFPGTGWWDRGPECFHNFWVSEDEP